MYVHICANNGRSKELNRQGVSQRPERPTHFQRCYVDPIGATEEARKAVVTIGCGPTIPPGWRVRGTTEASEALDKLGLSRWMDDKFRMEMGFK